MLSCFSRARLFATPWTTARQSSLSVGFSRQEYWSGLPSPPPEDLPNPRIEPVSSASPALQADSLPLSHQGSPLTVHTMYVFPHVNGITICKITPPPPQFSKIYYETQVIQNSS